MTALADRPRLTTPATPRPLRRARSRGSLRRVLLYVALCGVALVMLLPFFWMLSASVRTQGDLTAHPATLWPTHWYWSNYVNIWKQIPFGRQLLNTAVFAGSVAVISVLIDSMAGYALARFDFRGRNLAFVLIIMTMMLPIQVTLIPIFRLLIDLHWIDTYQGLIVPRTADAFGIFLMRQFFFALPKDLEDAARVDGASEFRIWWQVMMPLALPAVLTLGLFNMLANWNDLLWPLIVTTDIRMETLPAGLALFKGQHVTEYGLLMAGSVLALLPMVIAFLFVQRRFIEGIATTGIK
jgi:multiple sugar transport system permease protein